jgi:hypothetical protein
MAGLNHTLGQTATPPRYVLEAVPDQSVWSTTKAFLIHWNDMAGVTMEAHVDPEPMDCLLETLPCRLGLL